MNNLSLSQALSTVYNYSLDRKDDMHESLDDLSIMLYNEEITPDEYTKKSARLLDQMHKFDEALCITMQFIAYVATFECNDHRRDEMETKINQILRMES